MKFCLFRALEIYITLYKLSSGSIFVVYIFKLTHMNTGQQDYSMSDTEKNSLLSLKVLIDISAITGTETCYIFFFHYVKAYLFCFALWYVFVIFFL